MRGTSRNGSGEHSVQNRRGAPSLQVKLALAALTALAALALRGCASARGSSASDFEPNVYNPNTGYPAIGGGVPWHM